MTADTGYALASIGQRATAWLLDAALGLLLAVGLVTAAGADGDVSSLGHLFAFKSVNGQAGHQLSAAMNPTSAGLSALQPIAGLLVILTVIAVSMVAYRVVTTALWGAGLGKALLGIRVVVEHPVAVGAELPGWGRSWKRWVVPQVPGLIPLPATGLLAYAPALRDPRRRGLHDRAAGTVVIDIRSPLPRRHEPVELTAAQNADYYLTVAQS